MTDNKGNYSTMNKQLVAHRGVRNEVWNQNSEVAVATEADG